MQVIGVGTDIVSIERIERIHARHGERFECRILADGERRARPAHGVAAFLAKRFAAKEALAKALGTGFTDGVHLSEIEVVHNSKGRPGLALHGTTRSLAERLGVREMHLSLADERHYAVAHVLLIG